MEKRKNPAVRFKGFEDDWEQRKFGEITSKYEDPIPTPHDGYYRLGIRSHAKGTFHSYVAKGQELETAQMHRVAAGNFIVNITFGWEHAVAITDENDAGKLVSHRFPQFSFAEGMVPAFFRYVIVDEKFRHHLWLASPGGAGRNRVLKLDEMLNYLMRFPSRDEQIKIAEFFRHLDNLITLHQRKLEKLQLVKKSMLEKMFPKNDLKIPEIRFEGFTDDWEQRKLGEYVSITSGEAPSKFEVGTELYVKVDDLNYNDKYVVDTQNKVAEHSTIKRVTKGSVIFPKRGAAIMTNKVRILGIDSYMDTNMMSLSSEKLDSEFLYNIISKEGLYKIADTSTIPQINNKHIEPYEVIIPSLDEQKRIGVYFRSLDHLITLHQRKLAKMKSIKKSLLEKLFVQ